MSRDEILEALFDSVGVTDEVERRMLSRASEAVLLRIAPSLDVAILESFWRRETCAAALHTTGAELVEVHCRCPAELAEARFNARRRHPGHLDGTRDFAPYAARSEPLGLGRHVLSVDTSSPADLDALADEVRPLLPSDLRSRRATR